MPVEIGRDTPPATSSPPRPPRSPTGAGLPWPRPQPSWWRSSVSDETPRQLCSSRHPESSSF